MENVISVKVCKYHQENVVKVPKVKNNPPILESVKDPASCMFNGLIISAGPVGRYIVG